MVFLGIIVAAAAVAAGVGVVAENSSPATLSVFGQHVPAVGSTAQVFVAGAAVTMIFVFGLLISSLAMGRSMRVRRELRDLQDEHEETLSTLARENQHLQRELAQTRHGAPGDVSVTGRPGDPASPFFDQSV